MVYNVSQLLMDPTGSTRSFVLEEPLPGPGGGPDGDAAVSGIVKLLRTHQGLLLTGSLQAQAASVCSRCLGEFRRQTTLELEEEGFATIDPVTGRRMHPPEESEGVLHIDARQQLDLTEVLRQYLLAEEPLKLLCRPDCSGLCPQCGANLNQESCPCSGGPIDPRWGALAALLPNNNQG